VQADSIELVTYADGRSGGGIRQLAATDDGLDSAGDIFVFDQQLLAADAKTIIGRNAGYCVRTDPGAPDFSGTDHPDLSDDPHNNYGQCSWTLSFSESSNYAGSITVSGREADLGTSVVAIVGGSGDFAGASGTLSTTPITQEPEGVLFRQELVIKRPGREPGCAAGLSCTGTK
jgi:hypothetical protein